MTAETADVKEVLHREPLEASDSLWRYMDMEKYFDLITSEEIFLAAAAVMEDPWEGSTGPEDEIARSLFVALAQAQLGSEERAEEKIAQIEADRADDNRRVFINCWHRSHYESAAMWSLYGPRGKGIAVHTSVKRLCTSIGNWDKLFIARVEYRDQQSQTDASSPLYRFTSKLKSYEHEQEVRLLRYEPNDPVRPLTPDERSHHEALGENPPEFISDKSLRNSNYRLHVDVPTLIAEVVVAPGYPDWMLAVLKQVSQKFGVHADIRRSTLDGGRAYL